MRTLLVWPKFESFSFWNFEEVCRIVGVKYMTPPLGLLTVAALLPPSWELRLVDENVRPLSAADLEWAEMVFVGSKIVHRQRALRVIQLAKDAGKRVVVGGPDPTLSPAVYERTGADHLCLGEGEITVPRLLADLSHGVAKRRYAAECLADMQLSPTPRFDLIDFQDYLYIGIQYSRGCPYTCEFCNVIDIFSNKYRTKSAAQVTAELESLYELGYRGQVDFFDDNFAGHFKEVKALLRAIVDWQRSHHFPFQLSTSLTLNVAKDDELLELLRMARFKAFLVGIETPDEKALRAANKSQNVGFSIPEAVDRIYRKAGATVHSGFLLGLDGEANDIAEQIIRCIDETSIPWVMAGIVYPLPGTKLARRLDRQGRLFPKARSFDDDRVRDQISAGLQFRPERPSAHVVGDLIRILRHSFDPVGYFRRCAEVATRLDTIPSLLPGWRVGWRNAKAFMRLCWKASVSPSLRGPFWRAFWRVLVRHPKGLEALITLSVLYVHFQHMLPYCYEQLEHQLSDIDRHGEETWLASNLAEAPADGSPMLSSCVARRAPLSHVV